MNTTPEHSLDHDHHDHSFSDIARFVKKFDAPERDLWQKPDEVIAALDLTTDAIICEIGSGTGYFAVRIAPMVPEGKVIALDTQPEMVAWLKKRATDIGLANIDARLVTASGEIPIDEPFDLLFTVDSWHHVADRTTVMARYLEHLKPDGKVVIIDRHHDAPEGTPIEFRLPGDTVVAELASIGLTCVADLNFLRPNQFFLAFERER